MKSKSNKNEIINKEEVNFTDHNQEFYNFFEARKLLCDELSGLKHVNLTKDKEILIKRYNFIYGFKRLESFISDYSYNIKDNNKLIEIESKFKELLLHYRNNENYKIFSRKEINNDLNHTSEIKYNNLYFYYLIECFKISHLFSVCLQKSLNISTSDIVKDIKFANYKGFFNNLSVYKQEMNEYMSKVNLKNLFASYKKMLGYYFTYKFLIGFESCETINELNTLILSIIIDEDVLRFIRKYLDDNLSKSDIVKCDELIDYLKFPLKEIYNIINTQLSYKNILPKSIKTVMRDNTAI